jgi:hypothetical protein
MVKHMFRPLALVTALISVSFSAHAQDTRATGPVVAISQRVIVPPSPGQWVAPLMAPTPGTIPPSNCNPCLWYAGNIDPSSSSVQAFANENTVSVPGTTITYVGFQVPAKQEWEVTGAFVNALTNDSGVLDPKQGVWAITNGMSSGEPGTTLATGTATATVTPTGRSALGYTEYTVQVGFAAVRVPAGAHWISVQPQCTNSGDPSCTSAEFFLSNTNLTNSYGPPSPKDKGIFDSDYFGYYYTPLCNVDSLGCQYQSAGLIGTTH